MKDTIGAKTGVNLAFYCIDKINEIRRERL